MMHLFDTPFRKFLFQIGAIKSVKRANEPQGRDAKVSIPNWCD